MNEAELRREVQSFQKAEGRFSECESTPEMVDLFVSTILNSKLSSFEVYSEVFSAIPLSDFSLGLVLLMSKLAVQGYGIESLSGVFDLHRKQLIEFNPAIYAHLLAIIAGVGQKWAMDEVLAALANNEFIEHREAIARSISTYIPNAPC